jgi:hypothetical protein
MVAAGNLLHQPPGPRRIRTAIAGRSGRQAARTDERASQQTANHASPAQRHGQYHLRAHREIAEIFGRPGPIE